MENVISATEARIHFGELMRRVVERDESVIVERGGKPEVVIISIAEYERLRATGPDNWLERVDKVRERIRQELGGRILPSPEEVIREMREERDAQLLDNLR
jgi:prevent-host-death family protein